MSESVPLVKISRAQSTNKFTNKAEVAMPLGDGGSYFFLSNIIAGDRRLSDRHLSQMPLFIVSTRS